MTSQGRQGPLTDIRVLDCSTVLAGPFAAAVLADFGADVIKIEHPRRGDSMRGHGAQVNGEGIWWKLISRNKRCVGLDLSDPEASEIFKQMIADADVVVENFRPGTLERWGLGWNRLREINPGLVLCRVTGFGQDGPYSGRPAFGTLMESMSGFAYMTGAADGPPTLPPFGLADSIAGLTAVGAVLMALRHRDAGGGGQVVDLSILEPITATLGPHISVYDQLGLIARRQGNRSVNNAPRNIYRSSDGAWLAVSTSSEPVATRALRLIGHPEVTEQPWFSSGAGRAEHSDELDEMMSAWIGARTAAEVIAAFEEAEVALAPVYDVAEYLADPQVVHRQAVTEVADEELGAMRMQNVLFRLSETPGKIRHTGRRLGADTDGLLSGEMGVTADDLARLRARGVVA